MWLPNDKRWMFFFIPFLTLVVGLLLWLHIFGVPRMEGEVTSLTDYKGFILTTSAPQYVEENLELVDSRLPPAFKLPRASDGKLSVIHADPPGNCRGELDGVEVELPCEPGWVTVVLWHQKMANCLTGDCEAGKAFWDGSSCILMLPPTLEDALPVEMLTAEDGVFALPPKAEALAVAHEWVHCRRRVPGHVYTPIFGPFISIPTGHLMHPNLLKQGWSTKGLEEE